MLVNNNDERKPIRMKDKLRGTRTNDFNLPSQAADM
jgi:hypothetical protein